MEEIINLLTEETKRNTALASIASETVIREDYLKKASLFEKTVKLLKRDLHDEGGKYR